MASKTWQRQPTSAATGVAIPQGNARGPAFNAPAPSPSSGSVAPSGPTDPPAREEVQQRPKISTPKVNVVDVDGVALMRIIKHCADEAPTLVAGVLLGLEVGNVLELTHCFPALSEPAFTSGDANEEYDGEEGKKMSAGEYSLEMMKKLRAVNVDNNTVGWYRSTQQFGSFIEESFVREMVEYHNKIGPNSICLVYDPFVSTNGQLALKAFRLRSSFVAQYHEGTHTDLTLDANGRSSVLEELPVRLSNSRLGNAFLWDIQDSPQGAQLNCDFERLDLSNNGFLDQNLDFLADAVDDMVEELEGIANHNRRNDRRRAEREKLIKENEARVSGGLRAIPIDDKPLKKPDRLNALLHGNKIDSYCKQINQFSGKGFSKLFLAGSLQK